MSRIILIHRNKVSYTRTYRPVGSFSVYSGSSSTIVQDITNPEKWNIFLPRTKHLLEQKGFNKIQSFYHFFGSISLYFLLIKKKKKVAIKATGAKEKKGAQRRPQRQCRRNRMPIASGIGIRRQWTEAMNSLKQKLNS